jgi:hypothetical protein
MGLRLQVKGKGWARSAPDENVNSPCFFFLFGPLWVSYSTGLIDPLKASVGHRADTTNG